MIKNCALVLTDSGGLQKEAYFFNKYCITMRDQTEWVELIEAGANVLVGADADLVVLDPNKEKTISAATQQSAIDYNVFEGHKVKGLPRFTLTRGQVAVYDGEIRTQEGHGEFVKREPNTAVNKALSTWKELTSPRPVQRSGIPATGV